MASLKKSIAYLGGGVVLMAGALVAPVVYTEAMCNAPAEPQNSAALITASEDQRPEARTAFVVPEWEIVYAYEDLAYTLKTEPPHAFDYLGSIRGFWSTLCEVSKEADRLGDPGADAKKTIYTIGVSFTAEMALKGLYENTIGVVATVYGGSDSPQDQVERDMAEAYGTFLHQTPWYLFPFDKWTDKLWDAPVEGKIRGWERRLALGAEWKTKAAYARVIEDAVSTMEPDKTTMKAHVIGVSAEEASELPYARVVKPHVGGLILEVDRYRKFTHTAEEIAALGGDFTEIAGNDDILVSVLSHEALELGDMARIVRRTERALGLPDRVLVAVKMHRLTDLIRSFEDRRVRVAHIYDY